MSKEKQDKQTQQQSTNNSVSGLNVDMRRELTQGVVNIIRKNYPNEFYDLLSVITADNPHTNDALTLGFIAGFNYLFGMTYEFEQEQETGDQRPRPPPKK